MHIVSRGINFEMQIINTCWSRSFSTAKLSGSIFLAIKIATMLKYHHLLLLATNLPFTIAFKLFNATTKCPITLDGRISTSTNLSTFDTLSSPFNPDYSKGQNLSWSEILLFPSIPPSRFDSPIPLYKPLEVTISNASIFVPGGGSPQFGFRRAGLLLGNGSDASNVGVHTYHWSVMQDEKRKMNLSHEYMNVWHERNDYTANQWSLNAGVMLEQDKPLDSNVSTTGLERRLWKVLDKENDVVWTTGIKYGVWENWGLRMDVDEK